MFFKGRNSSSSRVGHVGLVSEVLPGGKFKFIHASCSKGICEERVSPLLCQTLCRSEESD